MVITNVSFSSYELDWPLVGDSTAADAGLGWGRFEHSEKYSFSITK